MILKTQNVKFSPCGGFSQIASQMGFLLINLFIFPLKAPVKQRSVTSWLGSCLILMPSVRIHRVLSMEFINPIRMENFWWVWFCLCVCLSLCLSVSMYTFDINRQNYGLRHAFSFCFVCFVKCGGVSREGVCFIFVCLCKELYICVNYL